MQSDKNIPIISITDRASARVQEIVKGAESDVIGLRIGIKTAGCSGLQYNIEFAKEQQPFEDAIDVNGVRVLIDPAAVLFWLEQRWIGQKISSIHHSYSIIQMKLLDAAVAKVFLLANG